MNLSAFLVLASVLGLVFGSFFTMLVWRMHEKKGFGGRSMCPHCRHELGVLDLVPLFSWIFLCGKCRYCRNPISAYYPGVEVLTMTVFVLVAWSFFGFAHGDILDPRFAAHGFLMFFIACSLLVTIISDAKYQLIYDLALLPATIIVFALKLALGMSAVDMLLGVLVGVAFFGTQYVMSRGKWMGFGDVKLAVFLGVAFGWYATIFLIALAYIGGAIVGVYLLATKEKKLSGRLPLGVFLGLAGLFLLVFGVEPIEHLLRLR